MTLAPRPDLGFPGYWISSPLPGGVAMFHIVGGDAALEKDGSMATGSGVIDHVSLSCQGYYQIRDLLDHHQLPYRENLIASIGLWQIFVYDPSGVLLELTFSQDGEKAAPPQFEKVQQYRPGEGFFNPDLYSQFGR